MANNRKKWSKPQLIVLGRGTPEESVLAGCKLTTIDGATTARAACNLLSKGKCTGAICSADGVTS